MTSSTTATSATWRTVVAIATATLLLVGLAGSALAHGPSSQESNQRGQALGRMAPGLGAELAQVRAATARYHNVEVAKAAGYEELTDCVSVPGMGAMGHHYVKFPLVGEPLDPRQPEALLYVPGPNGQLRLVGVEFITADEDAVLFDQGFDLIPDSQPQLYGLHVWVWQANPSGMFAPFNPNVSC